MQSATAQTSTIAKIARCRPIGLITAATIDLENPEKLNYFTKNSTEHKYWKI